MPKTLTAQQSDQMSKSLGRIDKIATYIQDNHAKWGMPFDDARGIVNDLDRTADEVETFAFGDQSFRERQTEVVQEVMAKEGKTAEVIQRDADEGYMSTFETGSVIQQDADEGYMSAYKDDETSDVNHGSDSSGRPLAPSH